MEDDPDMKWYDNIILIDILIFIFSFAFLAIAGGVMYVCYPPVMLAFQTS
jgi:cytochrome b subunit of formate dehydrogenase